MDSAAFEKALTWIADTVFPWIGVGPQHHLTIEYLGGEVLLVPQDDLAQSVATARRILGPKVRRIRDGVQSNLIGAPRRLDGLVGLFGHNIGTSWDNHTSQRTLYGNPEAYKKRLGQSLDHLRARHNLTPGRVLVVDAHTAPHLRQEVLDARAGGYDLVLRPVFQGGSPDVEHAPVDMLTQAYMEAYEAWDTTGGGTNTRSRIEPFQSLWEKRQDSHANRVPHSGCPFQSDCAWKSLSLDPDGSLYICQEMADAQHYPLGNARTGTFHTETWNLLARRTQHLDASCKKCPWLSACGGGCMNEAIERFGDPFAKTELCPVWTSIFTHIDAQTIPS
jgi:radical SAM protein with 4Fe4S-binding SPASM domain